MLATSINLLISIHRYDQINLVKDLLLIILYIMTKLILSQAFICSYIVYYTKLMLVKDLLLISYIDMTKLIFVKHLFAHNLARYDQINAFTSIYLLISYILYQINACKAFNILYIIPR